MGMGSQKNNSFKYESTASIKNNNHLNSSFSRFNYEPWKNNTRYSPLNSTMNKIDNIHIESPFLNMDQNTMVQK